VREEKTSHMKREKTVYIKRLKMKEFSDAEMLKSKIERIQEKISFAI
jgi:hypothetical protein